MVDIIKTKDVIHRIGGLEKTMKQHITQALVTHRIGGLEKISEISVHGDGVTHRIGGLENKVYKNDGTEMKLYTA